MDRKTVNYGQRARIGVLMPSGNTAAEPELSAMMPDGVSCHVTRLPLNGSSAEDLLGMTAQLEPAAILLRDTRPDLIVFHCTAVSTWDPAMDETLCTRIQHATGVRTATTAAALVRAIECMGARTIVLLTPYIDEINEREVTFLRHHGISVIDCHGLGLKTPEEMMAVEPESWMDLALQHRSEAADAYVISCTAIRTLPVIEEIEKVLGRPVITSNQAMAWHALRQSNVLDRVNGAGELLSGQNDTEEHVAMLSSI
ncbi:hypothetical protein [Caballeronia sp. J97]|uniref:maleate cis-trans isomerase family protein n=1 Tax=Caballeronia sp. J97 TaxID=2805429 RepID=UPI002AB21536|nr:hypothetical protein [Caballeronia sp. J97]